MNRPSRKAAFALLGIASAAFPVSPREGCAQSRAAGRPYSLSWAIETANRSPFRAQPRADGSAGAGIVPVAADAVTTTLPLAPGPRPMLRETGRRAAADEVSKGQLFLVTASAALFTDYLGVVLAGKETILPGGKRFSFLRALTGLATGALGPALSGGVLTDRPGAAALGSVLGSGVALVAVLPFAESGAPHPVLLLSYALIHGGITMVSVTR